jgi:Zn-dependent M16 (insulinase) family peptidase
LADIALGRHQQIIKRHVNNFITKISREEREDVRKKLEKMDEKEEQEHSPLISVMPILAVEKSPWKPVEQSIQDKTEGNNIEGIDDLMI